MCARPGPVLIPGRARGGSGGTRPRGSGLCIGPQEPQVSHQREVPLPLGCLGSFSIQRVLRRACRRRTGFCCPRLDLLDWGLFEGDQALAMVKPVFGVTE